MPEPGLVTNAQAIDLLGIGGWASDALLEQEACHAVSEESHPLDKNEETTIQAPRESQEKQNVTSTKDEIAITKGSTLVLHGKSLLDEGLFGLWLSQEFTHVLKERVVSCLEGGLLACDEILAKMFDSNNMECILDIVAHFPTGCGESGLSDEMT